MFGTALQYSVHYTPLAIQQLYLDRGYGWDYPTGSKTFILSCGKTGQFSDKRWAEICPREFPRVIRHSLGAAPLGKVGLLLEPPEGNFSRQHLRLSHCLSQTSGMIRTTLQYSLQLHGTKQSVQQLYPDRWSSAQAQASHYSLGSRVQAAGVLHCTVMYAALYTTNCTVNCPVLQCILVYTAQCTGCIEQCQGYPCLV